MNPAGHVAGSSLIRMVGQPRHRQAAVWRSFGISTRFIPASPKNIQWMRLLRRIARPGGGSCWKHASGMTDGAAALRAFIPRRHRDRPFQARPRPFRSCQGGQSPPAIPPLAPSVAWAKHPSRGGLPAPGCLQRITPARRVNRGHLALARTDEIPTGYRRDADGQNACCAKALTRRDQENRHFLENRGSGGAVDGARTRDLRRDRPAL